MNVKYFILLIFSCLLLSCQSEEKSTVKDEQQAVILPKKPLKDSLDESTSKESALPAKENKNKQFIAIATIPSFTPIMRLKDSYKSSKDSVRYQRLKFNNGKVNAMHPSAAEVQNYLLWMGLANGQDIALDASQEVIAKYLEQESKGSFDGRAAHFYAKYLKKLSKDIKVSNVVSVCILAGDIFVEIKEANSGTSKVAEIINERNR